MSGSIRARRMFGLLALAALLVLSAALGAEAEAKKKKATKVDKIAFSSKRTTGQGVNNPTGDLEIFVMNPDGTQLKQLTFNTADDFLPTLSPGGQKIAYQSIGIQSSNPEGDTEVYVMNSDGSGLRNLTNTAGGVDDSDPDFSPGGQKIAYESDGAQASNPEGDDEVYVMNPDGSGQRNLTNNSDIGDFDPVFSPGGKKIAYESNGPQASNFEGDFEIYSMNSDGSGQRNLTRTTSGIRDLNPSFSPGGKIVYESDGVQSSNPEGDDELYSMNPEGTSQRNLTNTAGGVDDSDPDFLPGSNKIAYQSDGVQSSNPEGDFEVYLMNLDGSTQQNVTDTAGDIDEFTPDFSPSGKKIAFEGFGAQASNPEGDDEVYVMNSDGSNQQNLSNTGSGIGDFEPVFGKVRR